MKKTLQLAIVLAMGFSPTISNAQSSKDLNGLPPHRTCGTNIPDTAWEHWFSGKVQDFINSRAAVTSYTIPIIIHIIHSGTAVGSGPNITLAQAQSELTALNADYSATNSDISSIPSTFTAVQSGNTGVQFCLAKVDPTGNVLAEVGVERINRVTRGWTDPNTFTTAASLQSYFDGTIKPASIWDPTKYLNVWVAQMDGSGLLGYASFPAGTGLTGLTGVETATTSGVVINEKSWGTIGTAATPPYNKGRTATHEIGHWLGLRHIWGDGTCATDYCNDTPPAQTSNFGCPTHPYNVGVCTGNTTGEMFMNYMDYVDDGCMYMFTQNQLTRIQTTMANGTYRTGLNTSGKCNTPYTLDASISAIINPAAASSSCATTVTPVVTLSNLGSTTLTSVTIKYSYDGGTVSNYAWTGSLTSGSSATVTLPTSPALSVAAHTITVATNNPNGSTDLNTSNDSKTNSFTITAPPVTVALPFTEGFQGTTFVPAGWVLNNPDGDGTWVRTTTAGGYTTSTASALMDSYTPATSTVGLIDEMKTPHYNFSALSSITMKFDVAYARYSTTLWDSLIVLGSSNCGVTWTRVYAKGSSGLATSADNGTSLFVPTTAAQWRTETVNLSAFAGQSNVGFVFQCKSGWGQAMYVDNINIASSTVPVANFSATPTTVCAGSSVTFTDLSTNTPTSWTWTFTGGTPATSTLQNPVVVYNTPGTYAVSLTSTNASGSSTPHTVTGYITVNAVPAAPTAANTGPYCAGATIALTASTVAGATYAWTGPASYTSTTQNPTRPTSTTAMAGTYSVTATVAGCTCVAATTAVVVNAVPATPTASNTGPYCAGSTITLNTPTVTGATYAWSGPSAYTAGVQNPTRPTATTAMAGTYSVTVTVGGCSSAAAGTTTVVVNAAPATPVPSINGSTTPAAICAGGTITLTTPTVTGATYAWTGPNTYSSAVRNPPALTAATTLMSGTYSLTVTTSGCTSAAGTTTVVVNPTPATPVPSINGSTTPAAICAGGTITLTTPTVTGATYAWSGPNSYTAAVRNPPALTAATTLMSGTYSLTVTTGGCTSAAGTVSIVVNPIPATPTATNSGPFCTGSTISLATPAVAGATYAWTGPSTFTSATQNPTRTGATTAMGGTYSVTVTTSGCTSAAGTTTVVVNTSVTPGMTVAASPAGAICAGTSVTFTATPSGGGTTPAYQWKVNGSNVGTNSPSFTSATLTTGQIVTCVLTSSSSCASPTTATSTGITMTVNPVPATPAVTGTSPVCAGSNLTLTTPTVTGAAYSWTGPNSFASSANNPPPFSATALAAGTYTLTETVSGCTSLPGTTTVVVNPVPAVPTAGSDSPVCAGSALNLTSTTVSGAAYTWSGPSSYTAGVQNPTLSGVTTAQAGTYSVTATAGGCSSAAATVTVVVNPSVTPSVAVAASPAGAICSGTSVTFTATPTNGGTTPAYQWQVNGVNAGTNSPAFTPATLNNGDVVTCILTSNANCAAPATATSTAITMTVTTTVTPSITITATPAGAICQGDLVMFTAAIVNGGTSPVYQWQVNSASAGTDLATFSSATLANGDVVTCTLTSNAACAVPPSATSSSIIMGVNPIPATPTITQSGTTLTSSSATGNQWYLNGNPIAGATSQNYTFTANGTYTVVVTTSGCASAASAPMVITTTGIDQAANPYLLNIYPNPSDGNFIVTFDVTEKANYVLELKNELGQLIYHEALDNFSGTFSKQLAITDYGKGIYIMSLTNSKHETIKKVIYY